MKPTTRLMALVLFGIVAVEFGGWSLLGFLTGRGSLTEFEEQHFRAGHGHAGVLLILALVFLLLAERSRYTESGQFRLSLVLLVGVLFQSGGFFVHMLVGEDGAGSVGTLLTSAGAVLLAVALIGLGMGLLRNPRADTGSAAKGPAAP